LYIDKNCSWKYNQMFFTQPGKYSADAHAIDGASNATPYMSHDQFCFPTEKQGRSCDLCSVAFTDICWNTKFKFWFKE
jgi:hypothetical protein